MKPAPMIRTRRGLAANAACSRAASVARAQRVHALERGLRRVRPWPRTDAGGDQQAVERGPHRRWPDRTTWLDPIQDRWPPRQPPLRIDRAQTRQLGVVSGTQPFSTCFESGGRSYGSSGSSPMIVRCPLKPSSRKASAPRSPASEARR